MHWTFRSKLLALILVFITSFILNILINILLNQYSQRQLSSIQTYYLPRIELRPKLEESFGALKRQFQDAVLASEVDFLDDASSINQRFYEDLNNAKNIIDSEELLKLNNAFLDYSNIAKNVSKRMIQGETGQDLINETSKMQEKQLAVEDLIKKISISDQNQLNQAFLAIQQMQHKMTLFSIISGATFFVISFVLYMWLSKDLIKSMQSLTKGFQRFADKKFDEFIPASKQEDINVTINAANSMAKTINELLEEQKLSLWQKTGQNKLASELSGELTPKDVVTKVLRFLTSYLEVRLGTIYYTKNNSLFRLDTDDEEGQKVGSGLLGQAALQSQLVVIDNLSDSFVIADTSLGHVKLQEIIFVPLYNMGKMIGILELGFFKKTTREQRQFLEVISEIIATTVDVSLSRQKMGDLLKQTQELAKKLQEQEKELIQTNEELQGQQVELEQSNSDLEEQRKLLENEKQKLVQLMGELEKSRDQVEIKAKEALLASQYKSQFLSNMSHELRTPLNIIMLLSQIFIENKDKSLSEDFVKNAQTIYSAGSDLLNLINDILDLSKIEAGKITIIPEVINIKNMANQISLSFKKQAENKNLNFSVVVNKNAPVEIISDSKRISQILKNLISNAIKFTDSGYIEVSIDGIRHDELFPVALQKKPKIKIQVKDSGIGIPEDKQELIFEAFKQADESIDRKYGGTGLGLSISKNLAKNLEGDLYIESTLGKGSVFTLLLPEMNELLNKEIVVDVVNSQNKKILNTKNDSNAPILIIEDDSDFANILMSKCKEYLFDYKHFADAESAIEYLNLNGAKAIILDIILPKMNGLEFLKYIRSSEKWRDIPVHVMSIDDREFETHLLNIENYLQKPVSLSQLNKVMNSINQALMVKPEKAILALNLEQNEIQTLNNYFAGKSVELLIVSDYEQAKSFMQSKNIDCIILSTNLSDEQSNNFLNYLRSSPKLQKIPVVVLSDIVIDEKTSHSFQLQTDGVIVKKDVDVSKRLLDEVSIFLFRVDENKPSIKLHIDSGLNSKEKWKNKKVLIVDDDIRNIFVLRQVLIPKGIEILTAENGLEALSCLEKEQAIDLILMDLMMPVLNGIETIKRIRSQSRYNRIPIIAITAKVMKKDREECLSVGANDYLTKPIDINELFRALEIWLRVEKNE